MAKRGRVLRRLQLEIDQDGSYRSDEHKSIADLMTRLANIGDNLARKIIPAGARQGNRTSQFISPNVDPELLEKSREAFERAEIIYRLYPSLTDNYENVLDNILEQYFQNIERIGMLEK